MQQITAWKLPDGTMNTEYGNITYKQWCEKEIKRIGGNLEIRTNNENKISVWKK